MKGTKTHRIEKVVSGGQTGVDRAALDAAMACGLLVGGWCPAGRRAEDGVLAARYPLRETPSPDYAERTAWNVRDSDGTLVLVGDEPAGGSALTMDEARRRGKPLLLVGLHSADAGQVRAWLARHRVGVLNVAGPREGEAPGIYRHARTFLETIFAARGGAAHEDDA